MENQNNLLKNPVIEEKNNKEKISYFSTKKEVK